MACVPVVDFPRELLSRDLDLVHIDNDDEIPVIHVRSKFRLVLFSEAQGDF